MKNKSIEFVWDLSSFDSLVNICKFDDAVNISCRYLKKTNQKILEAGCGTGRVNKYLQNLGYKNVKGIELSANIVKQINKKHPELDIVSGDILKMPYPSNYFDTVLCYGVVEHFPLLGLQPPLSSLKRVLRKGGTAIVSVPSFNTIRQIQFFIFKIKKIVSSKWVPYYDEHKKYLFNVFPTEGSFFEYRLNPIEFENECRKAGFKIIESVPIYHMDGMYHIFGKSYVDYKNSTFYPNLKGRVLNWILMKFPFFHNHMHLCVLQKN